MNHMLTYLLPQEENKTLTIRNTQNIYIPTQHSGNMSKIAVSKISISTRLKYYKRPEIQKAIATAATNKEIAVRFGQGGYGKRPDMISYPRDVLEFAKQGITSFHCSEELWDNPLSLTSKQSRKQQNELRIGWDLILDIDCKNIEFAKCAAILLIQALEYYSVKTVSIKFSGNNGFHIGVPFEAFPTSVNGTPTQQLFPEGARKIAALLKDMIKLPLAEMLQKNFTKKDLEVEAKYGPLIKNNTLNPYSILEIDTILISPRHLYRMPYSLHEKSGYASIPITKDQISSFQRSDAEPEKVFPSDLIFLDREKAQPDEGKKLLLQAIDFTVVEDRMEIKKEKKFQEFDLAGLAVPEELFPPCIKKIFKGLEDGKKRAIFVLLNFLTNVGWDYEKIEARLEKWNKVNPDPLREVILKGQVRHHKNNKKKVLPPNCQNKGYYLDMQVCHPDTLCKKIKNPLNYALRKAYFLKQKQREEEYKAQMKKTMEDSKKTYGRIKEVR